MWCKVVTLKSGMSLTPEWVFGYKILGCTSQHKMMLMQSNLLHQKILQTKYASQEILCSQKKKKGNVKNSFNSLEWSPGSLVEWKKLRCTILYITCYICMTGKETQMFKCMCSYKNEKDSQN